jgi:hypothetical protein
MAESLGADATLVRLKVSACGTGALAPMWEALSRHLLPRLAKGFAEQLKVEIEKLSEMPQDLTGARG